MPDRRGVIRWSVVWRTAEGDGRLQWHDCLPLLFVTKAEATRYIRQTWGYIATRSDLRRPPHNWRMPRPVRVRVVLEVVQ